MKHIVLTIFVFGALASYAFAQAPQPYQGSQCPEAVWCTQQGQGSATAYCTNEDCFEVTDGKGIRVVAVDDLGDFPKMWNLWHQGTLTKNVGTFPCELKEKQLKKRIRTRLTIPDNTVKCRTDLKTDGHLYHEHFLSNPAKKCLAWIECKQY